MAMYLGEDKVASLGSICNVSGSASKNLFDAYEYSENKTHTGNVSKYNIINPNEIEISYINGWSRLVLTLTGLEPNTDYTISAYLDKSNFNTSVGSGFYALDNYQDNAFTKGSGNVYFTFTSSSTGTFDVWFYGNWSGTNYSGSVIYKNIQLEKGSATEYEEYYEPTISIKDSKGDYHEVPYMTGKVSKNLFNKNDVLKGYWINNGVNEANALWDASSFIKVEPNNSYSFSSSLISGKSEIQATLNYYDNNKNYISNTYFQTLTKTVTIPSNCCYIKVSYRNDVLENIQFEKGSTITSYEEYYEPSLSIKNSNGVFQEVELNAPVILYTSESGTFDPITLTEEAEHFKYVEVFGVGNTMICSVKIPMDLYNTGSLFTAGASYQYQCGVSLTGKSMTFIYNRRLNISSNAWDNGNYFKIYRIIGYR